MLLIALILASLPAWGQTGDDLIPLYEASREAFNQHDLEQLMMTRSDDVVVDYVPSPPALPGKAFAREFYRTLLEGDPETGSDINIETVKILTAGNILVAETMITGTQTVEWAGIPPTGLPYALPHLTVYEFDGDKIAREIIYMDNVTLFTQLGAMPPPDPVALEPSFTLPDAVPTGQSGSAAALDGMARFNSHDMVSFTEALHNDIVVFMNTVGIPLGRPQYMALNELYLIGFPDLNGEVLRTVELGDGWVLVEVLWSGHQDGPYFGVPASGRLSQQRSAHIGHWDDDGLLTDFRFYYDNMTVLANIGAVGGGTAIQSTTWGQVKADHTD